MNMESIKKINEQIFMLQNEVYKEKNVNTTFRAPLKTPKVILEEPTIYDILLDDLIGDNDDTKVNGCTELNLDLTNTKLLETISIGTISINQKKIIDIYLPIFLILLIFIFIIFIIMI